MANETRQPVDLLVTHAVVHTLDAENRVFADGALAVRDGEIAAVGNTTDLEGRFVAAHRRDASGLHLIPGLVNTHNHLFQVFARTKGKDLRFVDWVEGALRPLIDQLDEEACYLAAMIGCLEAIRSGTTTILDYMYVANRPGLCNGVLRAFDEIGLRGILGRGFNTLETMPWGAPSTSFEVVSSALDDLARLQRIAEPNDRLSVALAPGAIWSMSAEGVAAAVEQQRQGLLVTLHLQENEIDDEHCLKLHGQRTIPFLAEAGLLGPNLLAVHAVQMPPENMDLFTAHDVAVSHNPASNMILGSGVALVTEMLELGLRVGLATDGAASNDSQSMIEAMKLAALLQKGFRRDTSALGAQQALEMATRMGADSIGMGELTGSLETGKRADFVLLNMDRPNTFPVADFAAALVYAGEPGNVAAAAVDGEFIYDGGEFTRVDQADLMQRAWKKFGEIEASLAD
jgi:5-methylthioadenosine/S-adenosylhomocysteine deaminase